ncbi:MAG: hypothetical protein EOM50_23290, partial [Erysipelotrichia bacterium]|nr:hypothetical protein [Erysipelotrichia bacterium]
MELKDILLKKLDSLLNPKVENRLIIGFFTIGSLLVGIPTISSAFSVTYKETTVTAELSNSSDIAMVILGVICLG